MIHRLSLQSVMSYVHRRVSLGRALKKQNKILCIIYSHLSPSPSQYDTTYYLPFVYRNDEINKKMREKFHWNKRIKELGGLDFNAIERKQQIEEGDDQVLHGKGGYRYFGAAKDLPGVKELFEKRVQNLQSRKRGDILQHITPDYYGWRDEEDGVLLELEAAVGNKKPRLGEPAAEDDEDTASEEYLDVPSQEEMAQLLLAEKKKALLAKFTI